MTFWTRPNPEQEEGRFLRVGTPAQAVVTETIRPSDVEIIVRRKLFLHKLATYVPRRPARYADRKWLEGYCLVASEIHLRDKWDAARELRWINHHPWMIRTTKDRGFVDALLDSVGC